MKLIPSKKSALVELIEKYEGVATLQEKYNTQVKGVCLSVGDPEYKEYVGNILRWNEFREGDEIDLDGKKYCFVLLEDVLGYEIS